MCESSGRYCTYQVEPPLGYLWDGDLSALKVEWRKGDADWRDAAIQDAIERIAQSQLILGEIDE